MEKEINDGEVVQEKEGRYLPDHVLKSNVEDDKKDELNEEGEEEVYVQSESDN